MEEIEQLKRKIEILTDCVENEGFDVEKMFDMHRKYIETGS